jgi:hypothetical protein
VWWFRVGGQIVFVEENGRAATKLDAKMLTVIAVMAILISCTVKLSKEPSLWT